MNIPKEVLDNAADAAESRHENWGSWEDVARAVIEVAGPALLAEAWDEGRDAAHDELGRMYSGQCEGDCDCSDPTPNPYRTA